MTIIVLVILFFVVLIFSGFVAHPEDQFLAGIQFVNPVKLIAADLTKSAFLGQSNMAKLVAWTFDKTVTKNRTEIFIDCQKKKILATKLKQVRLRITKKT